VVAAANTTLLNVFGIAILGPKRLLIQTGLRPLDCDAALTR